MPRGQQKYMKAAPPNGEQQKIMDKLISSFCDIKNIPSANYESITKLFSECDQRVFSPEDVMPSVMEDLCVDIQSAFRIDHDYSIQVTLIPPPTHVIKDFTFKLPPAPQNMIYRIVLLVGTHEVFYLNGLKMFLGQRGIFLTQGHAMKISAAHGEFSYDNKGKYDNNLYPGRGFKRPERRHLIIFDFISDQEGEATKAAVAEVQRASGTLTESGGIVSDIVKKLGFGKTE